MGGSKRQKTGQSGEAERGGRGKKVQPMSTEAKKDSRVLGPFLILKRKRGKYQSHHSSTATATAATAVFVEAQTVGGVKGLSLD